MKEIRIGLDTGLVLFFISARRFIVTWDYRVMAEKMMVASYLIIFLGVSISAWSS